MNHKGILYLINWNLKTTQGVGIYKLGWTKSLKYLPGRLSYTKSKYSKFASLEWTWPCTSIKVEQDIHWRINRFLPSIKSGGTESYPLSIETLNYLKTLASAEEVQKWANCEHDKWIKKALLNSQATSNLISAFEGVCCYISEKYLVGDLPSWLERMSYEDISKLLPADIDKLMLTERTLECTNGHSLDKP